MKVFPVIILAILAFLSGGCSLLMGQLGMSREFAGDNWAFTLITLSGFPFAAVCIWAIVWIHKPGKKPDQK